MNDEMVDQMSTEPGLMKLVTGTWAELPFRIVVQARISVSAAATLQKVRALPRFLCLASVPLSAKEL